MESLLQYWKRIYFQFDKKLENVLRQQHLAAQLVALVGRYLVSPKPDSSNINMKYIAKKEMLLGNQLENGVQVGLQLSKLEIHVFKLNKKAIAIIQLNEKSFEFALAELRLVLSDAGVDISKLKNEQPYFLPSDFLEDDKFHNTNKFELEAATLLRHNAEIIINELAREYKNAIPVRIWPHHFDTGTFFATARNQAGEVSQTIGLGWAMPDEMIKEPYFYLSFWSEKELRNISKLTPLEIGNWMTPGWKGAVLKHSEIINETSAQKQHQLVKQFFNEGVSVVSRLFKRNL